jgi:hypothetical protein
MYATTATLYYDQTAHRINVKEPSQARPTLKIEVDLGRGLNLIIVTREGKVSIETFTHQGDAMSAGFKAFQAGHATSMIPCFA